MRAHTKKISKEQTIYQANYFWRNLRRGLQRQIEIYGRPVEPINMIHDRFRAARQAGFRSDDEVRISKELDALEVPYRYEEVTFPYHVPAQTKKYTPDFILPNAIVVEFKGLWDSADRKKITAFREQYPSVDFRMVFGNPNTRISKQSKTTYAAVCKKLGIPFAKKSIPTEWLLEPFNAASHQAIHHVQNPPQD